jgi:alpha-galactosidase
MSLPTKIVVIGAGSNSFGENTLSSIMASKKLKGSTLALVDRNVETLKTVKHLADRINQEWNSGFNIISCEHYEDVLDDADFVVSAIEVGAREALWRQDFKIPLKYGIRQPYAENGGPGGFAHAARNLVPVMAMVQEMEKVCPNAWFINFTNPMARICDAINRHSRIKVVGLCHQIFVGYVMVGMALGKEFGIDIPDGLTGMEASSEMSHLQELVKKQVVSKLDIRACGLNHFTWILTIHDKRTGENLYPAFRRGWARLDPEFEPLTRRVFDAFRLFPVPGDTHLCEYIPWISNPMTKPWEKYHIKLYEWDAHSKGRTDQYNRLQQMAEGEVSLDSLRNTDSEGAIEMIENIAASGTHYHLAANFANVGQISNLPRNATVETPIVADGAGIHPVHMGALPEPIAELLRREITVSQLCVDSAISGNRDIALQCLLLDPVINDIELAKQTLDDYLLEYKEYLPQFWK